MEYNTLRKYNEERTVNFLSEYTNAEISEVDKEHLISLLTEELPVLRAKVAISQDELSSIIGISRQTYSAIETKKRKMSWNTFLSLILVFGYNEKTAGMLEACGAFPSALHNVLNNVDRRGKEE